MKGWRTVVLNALLVLLAVTDYLVSASGILPSVFSDPKQAAAIVVGVNVVNVVLRFVTTTPIGKRDASQ